MCGLFGIASVNTLSNKEKDFFETLGRLSLTRGKDSTGVFHMRLIKHPTPKEKEDGYTFYYGHAKDVCEPSYFFNRKEWKDIRTSQHHIYMGHNRHATIGAVTKAAAHPFVIKDGEQFLLAGMHNGTLSDYIDKNGEHHSDSHKLYERISQVGLKEALEELKERSAYALAFVDSHSQPTFFRNNKRPLYLGLTKNQNTAVWASEERFIKAAEQMYPIEIEGITLMGTNTLVKIDLQDTKVRFVIAKDFLKKEVIERHEKDYVYTASRTYGGVGYSINNPHYNYSHNSRNPRYNRREQFDMYDPSMGYHEGTYDDFDSEDEAWASQYLKDQRENTRKLLEKAAEVKSWNQPKSNGVSTIHNLHYSLETHRLIVEKSYTSKPSVKINTYLLPQNPDFMPMMKMWEEQEHERLGIPYLALNSRDEILVKINSKKKKKVKIIGKGHVNFYGWWELYEQQESAFEDWAMSSDTNKIKFVNRFDMRRMNFNSLNREAAKISKEWKALQKEQMRKRLEEEKTLAEEEAKKPPVANGASQLPAVTGLPDFITRIDQNLKEQQKKKNTIETQDESDPPFEPMKLIGVASSKKEVEESLAELFRERQGTAWTDGLVYDTGFSVDSIDLVNDKLSKGCLTCGNPQVLQDTAMWISSGEFVCHSCFHKDITKQTLPQLAGAKAGRVYRR